MAIQNASDLLIYRKSPSAVAQVTRVRIKESSPLNAAGTIKIINSANASGVNEAELTTNSSTNNGTSLLSVINLKLTTSSTPYTSSSLVTDGDFKYRDFTNVFAGDLVNTLSFADGSATIDEGAITVTVITSGETANAYEPVAFSTSASFSVSTELRDKTNKDSLGFAEHLPGLKSFEMSTDALQDFNADLEFQEFFNDIGSTTPVTIRFAQRATSGSTERFYEGSAFVTSVSMDAGVEENVTYSASFTGTAAVTTGTD